MKIAFRYLLGYKKKAVICIIGIAFSVMLVFSLVGISDRILHQYKEMIRNMVDVYDLQVYELDDETLISVYENECQDAQWKMINVWCGSIDAEYGENILPVCVKGNWQEFFKTSLLQGKEAKKAYEVCITENYAKQGKLKLGDAFSCQLYDDYGRFFPIELTVSGITANSQKPNASDLMFFSMETLKDLTEKQGFFLKDENKSVLLTYDKNGYDLNQITDCVARICRRYGMKFYGEHIRHNGEKSELYDEKGAYVSLSVGFYGICFVVFLCMVIFLYNIMQIGMTERIQQYGTWRCLGATATDLKKMMLTEEIMSCFGGILLGCVGGRALNKLVADRLIFCFLESNAGTGKESIWTYMITVFSVFVAILISVAIFSHKIGKLKPIDMVRYTENNMYVGKKENYRNSALEMAARNKKRNVSKSRMMTLTVFLATVLLIVVCNMVSSIDFDPNKDLSAIAKVSVLPSFQTESSCFISSEEVELLKQSAKVKDIYWQRRENGYEIQTDGEKDGYESFVVYSEELFEKFLSFNGLPNKAKNGVFVLYEGERPNYKEITLTAKGTVYGCPDAVQSVTLPVIGYVRFSRKTLNGALNNSEKMIILGEDIGKKVLGNFDGYTNVLVDSRTSAFGVSDVKSILVDKEYEYVSLQSEHDTAERQMEGISYLAMYMMVSVAVLLLFVITGLMESNFILRKKENGMLRCIGASKNWLEKTMIWEMMLIAIRAVVAAVVVAVPICVWLYFCLNQTLGTGILGYIIGPLFILTGVFVTAKCLARGELQKSITEMVRTE